MDLPPAIAVPVVNSTIRLKNFDQGTWRQEERQKGRESSEKPTTRGWTREDLYDERGSR
jgi:hypothetical protein